jgi:hypothetical protein
MAKPSMDLLIGVKPTSVDTEEEGTGDNGKRQAAQDIIDAIKAGDADALVTALDAHHVILDGELEEEEELGDEMAEDVEEDAGYAKGGEVDGDLHENEDWPFEGKTEDDLRKEYKEDTKRTPDVSFHEYLRMRSPSRRFNSHIGGKSPTVPVKKYGKED